MQIRDYQTQDAAELSDVFRKNIPHAFAQFELDEYVDFLRTNNDPYFVAEFDGRVVGAGGHYLVQNGQTAHLCWVFTDPGTKGVGRALVRHNIDIIRQ